MCQILTSDLAYAESVASDMEYVMNLTRSITSVRSYRRVIDVIFDDISHGRIIAWFWITRIICDLLPIMQKLHILNYYTGKWWWIFRVREYRPLLIILAADFYM